MFGRKGSKKVYRNSERKVIYRQSTDKVGDVLVNGAGVKYKIIGQRFHAPTGYDDGKLKVRILKIEPEKNTGLKPFEMNDVELKAIREKKIWTREATTQKAKKPAKSTVAKKPTVKKSKKK